MVIASPWWQALIVVGSALAVSSVSLLTRYRQKGHPFGSLAAARWAILAIVVAAAPAGVALVLPGVPPAYLGVAVPALLAVRGDRLHQQSKPSEDAVWYRVATLGVRLLLDRLEQQMDTDRDAWVKAQASKYSLDELEDATEDLYYALEGRASMSKSKSRLKSHRDAAIAAIERAQAADQSGDIQRTRREEHTARGALKAMLRLAYDSGNKSAAST
jgi:hypothetical protein